MGFIRFYPRVREMPDILS